MLDMEFRVVGVMFCHTALSCCCAKLSNAHGDALSKEHREKTIEGEQCAFVHRVRVYRVANDWF